MKLLGTQAAFSLRVGVSKLANRLLAMYFHVKGGSANLHQFSTLARHVVDKSSDVMVWAAVLELIDAIGPLTPPPSTGSILPTFLGTPVRANSSWLDDSETRERVKRGLFGEIRRCTFRGVEGFWDKLLNPETWCEEQRAMLRGVMTAYDGKT